MKPAMVLTTPLDGFRGYFYPAASPSEKTMIILLGDDGNDFLSQAAARWFTKYQGCNALCMALRENQNQDPGIDLWKLETVQAAISWLKSQGNVKIGIFGMSMQAVIALSAAARMPEISLVLCFAPCDYVPWGFRHGPVGSDKNAEYPTGNSLLTYQGEPLPFQSAGMEKEEYAALFRSESKKYREMHSRTVFDRSEEINPIAEETYIPAEQIRGAVLLVGAEDDSMWNSQKYIGRLTGRLKEKEFMFPVKAFLYGRGTHLLMPQRMLMEALPVIGGWTAFLFHSGRQHYKACKAARLNLDRKLTSYLSSW